MVQQSYQDQIFELVLLEYSWSNPPPKKTKKQKKQIASLVRENKKHIPLKSGNSTNATVDLGTLYRVLTVSSLDAGHALNILYKWGTELAQTKSLLPFANNRPLKEAYE